MASEHPSVMSFRHELTRRGGTGDVVILPDAVHTAALAAKRRLLAMAPTSQPSAVGGECGRVDGVGQDDHLTGAAAPGELILNAGDRRMLSRSPCREPSQHGLRLLQEGTLSRRQMPAISDQRLRVLVATRG